MEQYPVLQFDDALRDIRDVVAQLRSLGADKVGVTGFCMGGLMTYLTATSDIDVQAAVPFYGGRIAQNLGEPTCPTLLLFGGTDEYIPTEDIEAAQAHHGDQVVVYPQAGHGFFRDGSDSYDESAAADAWDRLTAHFAANLR
jgi:carboxymethylenebutenolidase